MVLVVVVDFLKIQNPGSEWGDGGHLPDCHTSRKNETILKVALGVDSTLPYLARELINVPLKVFLENILTLNTKTFENGI